MSKKSKRVITKYRKGVSNWLTILPIAEYGFELHKQNFWDSISLRDRTSHSFKYYELDLVKK